MARFRIDPKSGKVLVYSERTGKWRPERKKNAVDKLDYARPINVMPDIAEFVAHATDTPVLIGSRSRLAAYERSNNIRQCGDFRRGEIIARRKNKVAAEIAEARRIGGDMRATWSDFR